MTHSVPEPTFDPTDILSILRNSTGTSTGSWAAFVHGTIYWQARGVIITVSPGKSPNWIRVIPKDGFHTHTLIYLPTEDDARALMLWLSESTESPERAAMPAESFRDAYPNTEASKTYLRNMLGYQAGGLAAEIERICWGDLDDADDDNVRRLPLSVPMVGNVLSVGRCEALFGGPPTSNGPVG